MALCPLMRRCMLGMQADRNIKIYQAAYSYLKSITPDGVQLENYIEGNKKDITSLLDVYIRFIGSAQNYQRMPNVIKFYQHYENGELNELLCDFDVEKIASLREENLYNQFCQAFQVQPSDDKRNCWHKWSCSVIDSAKFVKSFTDVEDFKRFVNQFNYNVQTRMALPLLIQTKIRGIGFALACDALKELGFTEYSKPDVHLKDVLSGIGLCENNPYAVFEAIDQMAQDCKVVDKTVTPYKIDKIIWLICSGKFYNDKPKGNRHKKELIGKLKDLK